MHLNKMTKGQRPCGTDNIHDTLFTSSTLPLWYTFSPPLSNLSNNSLPRYPFTVKLSSDLVHYLTRSVSLSSIRSDFLIIHVVVTPPWLESHRLLVLHSDPSRLIYPSPHCLLLKSLYPSPFRTSHIIYTYTILSWPLKTSPFVMLDYV